MNKIRNSIFLDAPTLIENGLHKDMDYVILVYADTNTQIQRVKARDRLSNGDVNTRINSQMQLEEKKKFANIIIDNNGDLVSTQKQVEGIIEFFKSML